MLADCRRRRGKRSRGQRGGGTSKVKGDGGSKESRSDGYTKVERKGKKVTFPFEEPSARIDEVHDDWEHGEDKPADGSITPIEYIDCVIAAHAPSHMKDKSTKEKARHVEDKVSRLKQRLEDFKAIVEKTRQSDQTDRPERVASPVVIDLVTPEVHQAGSPEVASL
ncbi:hypothetical protein AX14_002278 [Amanita brunnescens Koide BX004]|nr:hypothetical protein AX14_002278 [Amanita brunnescens Koide BX004]